MLGAPQIEFHSFSFHYTILHLKRQYKKLRKLILYFECTDPLTVKRLMKSNKRIQRYKC